MRRYQLVLGGTVAGIAGVLAFPTKSTHLTIPSASAAGTSSSGASSGSSSAASGSSASGSSASGSSSSSSASPSGASTTRSATSQDEAFRYGDLAVKVTVEGSKITNISPASLNETDGRSAQIDSYAIPQLEQQVISANSVNIDGVSGATFTSQAFVNAVSDALSKLGIKA